MPFLPNNCTFNATCNEIGWEMLPELNAKANEFMGINSNMFYNKNLQNGTGIYPGEEWCNPSIPHCKWHLQTGIALVDFAFLMDWCYQIIYDAKAALMP